MKDTILIASFPNHDARAAASSQCRKVEKARFGPIATKFAGEMQAGKRFPVQTALFSAFSIPSVKPVQRLRVDLC